MSVHVFPSQRCEHPGCKEPHALRLRDRNLCLLHSAKLALEELEKPITRDSLGVAFQAIEILGTYRAEKRNELSAMWAKESFGKQP